VVVERSDGGRRCTGPLERDGAGHPPAPEPHHCSSGLGGPQQPGRVSEAVESLLSTIDTDRALRLGPPSPADEQLAYSEALLGQRAVEVGRAAHDLEAAATPTT
jgi:hypothetical protein